MRRHTIAITNRHIRRNGTGRDIVTKRNVAQSVALRAARLFCLPPFGWLASLADCGLASASMRWKSAASAAARALAGVEARLLAQTGQRGHRQCAYPVHTVMPHVSVRLS